MGARNKLNVAYLNGALIVAIVVGSAFESVWVFALVLGALVAGQVMSGELRFNRRE